MPRKLSTPSDLDEFITQRFYALSLLALCVSVVALCGPWQSPPAASPQVAPSVVAPEPLPDDSALLAIPTPVDTGVPRHMGYRPNTEGTEAFLKTLQQPTIREAGPSLFQARGPTPDREGVFLYRPLRDAFRQKYGREWIVGTQGIGDCVSWGWHHGIAIATAVEWKLGNIAAWELPATEAIYGGSRVEARGSPGDGLRPYGGYSDGSYGAAAAKFVTNFGVLFRRSYTPFDLTSYSASRAKEWGAYGCGGKNDQGAAEKLCREHVVKRVALVRTFDEAAAALESGYPVPVCSGIGFGYESYQPPRDKNGFLKPVGSWAHCMVFIGTRYNPPGLLCLNSWGEKWVSGPKYPDDMPEGSFWVDSATCTRMLSGGDSFAVSTVEGFPWRPINHGAWVHARDPTSDPNTATHYALSSLKLAL